jgi:hypothetical protein
MTKRKNTDAYDGGKNINWLVKERTKEKIRKEAGEEYMIQNMEKEEEKTAKHEGEEGRD